MSGLRDQCTVVTERKEISQNIGGQNCGWNSLLRTKKLLDASAEN